MPAPEITGTIATYADHALPVLVMLSPATRFCAAELFDRRFAPALPPRTSGFAH